MLLIDNYDSFTYNIVQYLGILGVRPKIIRNDETGIDETGKHSFRGIIISPGWGNPKNSGISMGIIEKYMDSVPIFGICLGMQCIAEYFGADIVRAPEPCHGKNSDIFFKQDFELFHGLKQRFSATRYHSLMISNPSDEIDITARTESGIPMALKIKKRNIYGVQFHPEAVLTENGIDIFRNFLKICGNA